MFKSVNIPKYEHAILKCYKDTSTDGTYSVFTEHHILSFNKYIEEDILNVIQNEGNCIIYPHITSGVTKKSKSWELHIEFTDHIIKQPSYIKYNKREKFTPVQALQDLSTYSFRLYCNYKMKLIYYENINGSYVPRIYYNCDTASDKNLKPLKIGSIPCMVLSKACNLYGKTPYELYSLGENDNEYGGYYIVNGNEYIISTLEQKTENMLYLNKDDKISKVWIQSKKENENIYGYYTTVSIDTNNLIGISVYIKKDYNFRIPLLVMFNALGVTIEQEIFELICNVDGDDNSPKTQIYYNILKNSFEEIFTLSKKKNAKQYNVSFLNKSKNPKEDAEDIIWSYYMMKENSKFHESKKDKNRFKNSFWNDEFLPHVGGIEELEKKKYHLALMVRTAMDLHLGNIDENDKEDYGNKRFILPNKSMNQLTKFCFNIAFREFKNKVPKDILKNFKPGSFDMNGIIANMLHNHYNHDKFTSYMERQMRTGQWPAGGTYTARGNYNIKHGVSKQLQRKSICNTISIMANIIIPVKGGAGEEKQIPMSRRVVHATQYGYICPHDTPEGKQVGIVKNKTYLSKITLYSKPDNIISKIRNCKFMVLDITKTSVKSNFMRIFINGILYFTCAINDMNNIYNMLIKYRRNGQINRYTSIVIERELLEIRIYTDAGRFIRPLYIVDQPKNKLRITPKIIKKVMTGEYKWKDLIYNKYIEYVSIHESKYSLLIASNDTYLKNTLLVYSHCEISSLAIQSANIMGIEGGSYNTAPRLTYGGAQKKQSIGTPVPNHYNRMDTKSDLLCRPEIPVAPSFGQELCDEIKYPNLYNVSIAMISYGGLNIEDSIQVDGGAIKRGFMDVKSIVTKQSKIQSSSSEEFSKPIENITKNYLVNSNYNKINENGRPFIGQIFEKGDVIIGKVKKISKSQIEKNVNSHNEYIDKSIIYTHIISGQVTKVTMKNTQEGKVMKVKIIQYRKVQIGDKFAARSAQKSTAGQIFYRNRGPHDELGNVPQILINVCAIGKRLTPSHCIVSGQGLLAVKLSEFLDSTSFNGIDIQKDVIDRLKECGFEYAGDKYLYNGYTGTRIKSRIYVAVKGYQRLPHMSANKVYARYSGSIQQKTKQPQHGRSKQGGLKYGEMATHSLQAHGLGSTHKEYTYNHSDSFERIISEDTNHWCAGNKKIKRYNDNNRNVKMCVQKLPWTTHMVDIYIEGLGISVDTKMDDGIKEAVTATPENFYGTPPYMTKYEKSKLLGARATHLSRNAKSFIDDTGFKSAINVVYTEFDNGKLDNMIIYRRLPGGRKFVKIKVGYLCKL